MSSTYVIGKRAEACIDEHGTVFYMLLENSYESRLHPRTPRWSVRFFGTYEACIRKIVCYSGGTVGGCTKGTASTPSAYIKQWRHELANPVLLNKTAVSARFGKGFYEIPESSRARVDELLVRHGFPPTVGDTLSFDMAADRALPLLAALTDGTVDELHPWRLLSMGSSYGPSRPDLGFAVPARVKATLSGVEVFKISAPHGGADFDHLLVVNGKAVATGWDSNTEQYFLEHVVAEAEVQTPGIAASMISEFQKKLADAKMLDPSVRVSIRKVPGSVEGSRWHLENFAKLRESVRCADDELVVATMASLRAAGVDGMLRFFPAQYIGFDVSEAANVEAQDLRQLDLLPS